MDHGPTFLASYWPGASFVPPGDVAAEWRAFDVESTLYECGQPNIGCWVMLRDANSGQRLALRTGPFEVWAMNVALGGREPPRPLTHRAMLNTIVALGAALNAVRIDRFIPDQHVFHAKLELRKMGENVLVDVRPSDAITIALAANVGILVAKEVVAELAKLGG